MCGRGQYRRSQSAFSPRHLVAVNENVPSLLLILAAEVCCAMAGCGLHGSATSGKGDPWRGHPSSSPSAGLHASAASATSMTSMTSMTSVPSAASMVSMPSVASIPSSAAPPSTSWALSSAFQAASDPTSGLEADATLLLPIPARKQDPDSPRAGWCGETAIQEALLHAGAWISQRIIHRSGKPAHQDLHASDIPVALAELGVRFTFFPPRRRGFDAFVDWVEDALRAGDPVLAGVKILPTEHPNWGLDHFVLVVGRGPRGLLVNTTWGYRAWVGDTSTEGLSFRNVAYGIRLRGLAVPPKAIPARLSIIEERADTVKLRVRCEGLASGSPYRIERTRSAWDPRPLGSESAIAVGDRVEKELAVASEGSSRFYCIPISGR